MARRPSAVFLAGRPSLHGVYVIFIFVHCVDAIVRVGIWVGVGSRKGVMR
jgi:hypothetical protein